MARIVVADDDADIRELVSYKLELAGHDVTAVGDGAAAVDACRAVGADLVLLDLMMPGIDGPELCRRIRQDASLSMGWCIECHRATMFAPMLPPVAVSLEEAARSVGLVIREIASRSDVLILGQGGQMWLAGYAVACHVQLVAPLALRVARGHRGAVVPAVRAVGPSSSPATRSSLPPQEALPCSGTAITARRACAPRRQSRSA